MPHPDLVSVEKLMRSFLEGRKFDGWRVSECRFDFYSSSYTVTFQREGTAVPFQFPTEMIDAAQEDRDPFKRRRIKSMLKEKLIVDDDGDSKK